MKAPIASLSKIEACCALESDDPEYVDIDKLSSRLQEAILEGLMCDVVKYAQNERVLIKAWNTSTRERSPDLQVVYAFLERVCLMNELGALACRSINGN